jgi:hypothetical protein
MRRVRASSGHLIARSRVPSAVLGSTRRMQIPAGVHIETLHNPVHYTYEQIERACAIAQLLNRGKLVLVEPPRS